MVGAINACRISFDAATQVLKKTNGVRVITQLACNVFDYLSENDVTSAAITAIGQHCRQFCVVLMGWRIVDRIGSFAKGDAYSDKGGALNLVRLTSRVAYVFNDLFATLSWLESWGVIAAKTGSNLAFRAFGMPIGDILPFVNLLGTGLDLGDHLVQFGTKPSFNATFKILEDTSRLVAIGLTNTPGQIPQLIRFGAQMTYGGIYIFRHMIKYAASGPKQGPGAT